MNNVVNRGTIRSVSLCETEHGMSYIQKIEFDYPLPPAAVREILLALGAPPIPASEPQSSPFPLTSDALPVETRPSEVSPDEHRSDPAIE